MRLNQATAYYPSGMTQNNLYESFADNAKEYLYNSKELQDELGLELYDYGARFYDPVLGRWHAVDPLAEMYNSYSPCLYVRNNPIIFIDPNGMNDLWYGDMIDPELADMIQENKKLDASEEEENLDITPEPQFASADNTKVDIPPEGNLNGQPKIPTCDDLKKPQVDLSLNSKGVSISKDNIKVSGISVINDKGNADLGVIGQGKTIEQTTRMEKFTYGGETRYGPATYEKTVGYIKFGVVKAVGCVVTRNGKVIEQEMRTGLAVPIKYRMVGAEISIMPFKH